MEKGPYICYKSYKLCSDHFVKTDYNGSLRLNSRAVPSVFTRTEVDELKQTSSLEIIPQESIPCTSGLMADHMSDSVGIKSELPLSANWSNIIAMPCSTPTSKYIHYGIHSFAVI